MVITGKIKELLKKHTMQSFKSVSVERIATGKFNSSFFIYLNEKEYVLRIAPRPGTPMVFYEEGMMAQEPEIHALVRKETGIPVPEIVFYDSDHDIIESDVLLMERLPGLPASEAAFLTDPLWESILFQIGEFLRELHAIHGEHFGYCGAHGPMQPQPTWSKAFELMWKKMITQIVDMGAYSRDQGKQLESSFYEHQGVFDHVSEASLLHMDVWAQNILVDREGRVTALLDWDRALWGDPEIEFAVLDYCGISSNSYWQGYRQVPPDTMEAGIRHAFYMLYEIQKYIIIQGLRRKNRLQAEKYRDYALQYSRKYL